VTTLESIAFAAAAVELVDDWEVDPPFVLAALLVPSA
jgi:hypothetical protein